MGGPFEAEGLGLKGPVTHESYEGLKGDGFHGSKLNWQLPS